MDEIQTPADRTAAKRWGTAAALVAAGIAGGVIMAGTVSANAASSTPTPSTSSSAPSANGDGSTTLAPPTNPNPGDPSKPQRSDETLLTGDVADKVTAAVLAKYPGATIVRVETDSDGVYEAHITKADGTQVSVEVDKSYTVTGEEAGGPGGMRGQGGMPGGVDPDPNDDDGPGTGNAPSGALTPNAPSTTSSSSISG